MGVRAVLFVVVGALFAGSLPVAAEAPAVPRIYLPEAKFEFGKVNAGKTVEHIFEVRNVGGSVLKIERVQSS